MKKKKLPKFKSEEEEVLFWDTHSPLDYVDFTEMTEPVVLDPALIRRIAKRSREKKRIISLRMEPSSVDLVKIIAQSHGSAYQSLIRMWITDRIRLELKKHPEIREKLRKRKKPSK